MSRGMRTIVAVFGATMGLALLGAAMHSPGIGEQVRREGTLRVWSVTVRVPWAMEQTPRQPFSNVQPPAWSATDASVATLQQRLQQRPNGEAAGDQYAQLGTLYLQKARETGNPAYYTKADGALQKSLELAPDNVAATLAMGSLHMARHGFLEALEWGDRAIDLAPQRAAAYGVAGDARLELGRYPAALETFQTMVDLRPDLASYSRVAYARELLGDLPGATQAMALAVDAGAPQAEGTNWARVQLGNLRFTAGDLPSAEREYQAALRALPKYIHALGGLAKVAAARGDLTRAATLYTQTLDIAPVAEYAIALGDVYQAAGNAPAAAREQALVRVIAQLQRANSMDIDMEMALFDVDHTQDAVVIDAAAQAAQAAYTRRPSIFGADAVAWTLYRSGRANDALPYAREALRLHTQDPVLLYHAGAIAAAAGNTEEARGYVAGALVHNPHFHVRFATEAQRLLRQLNG